MLLMLHVARRKSGWKSCMMVVYSNKISVRIIKNEPCRNGVGLLYNSKFYFKYLQRAVDAIHKSQILLSAFTDER